MTVFPRSFAVFMALYTTFVITSPLSSQEFLGELDEAIVAQQSSPEPQTPNSETEGVTLPEVVVEEEPEAEQEGYVVEKSKSGTKTDTPLIEVPQSISVITQDRLEAFDADNLGQALRYSVGVTGESFGVDDRGYDGAVIRGFSVENYRDGLRVRSPNFASFDFRTYAADRIELLRGPSAVLYGQSSTGGLVNFVSKLPLSAPFYEVELEAGSFDRFDGKFDFSGPIPGTETLFYRLTALGSTGDNEVDFIEDDRFFIAPALTWAPTSNTTLTLLNYTQIDDLGGASNSFLPASGTVFDNPNGTIPASRFTGEPDFDSIERKQFSAGYLFEHRFDNRSIFRQNARYEYTDVDFEELFGTGLDPNDPAQRLLTRGIFTAFAEARSFAIDSHVQAGLATGPLNHTFLLGVDYQRLNQDEALGFDAGPSIDIFDPVYGRNPFDTTPALFQDIDQKQQQIGFYIQDQIRLFDGLIVVLGGRYDRADTETDDLLADTETDQDDGEFTGKAGLVYVFDFGLAPYASYSESFEPTIGVDFFGEPFKPETGRQYEAGVKYQPFETNVSAILSLYDIRRQNLTATDPGNPNNQVQTGEVRSRGFEAEAIGNFLFGLDLIAAYTCNDLEITENSGVNEGNTPDGSPKHRASLWADYTILFGVLNGLGFGAGVRYVGETFGDEANSFEVPDYTLADAAIHYDWRGFGFAVNVQNVFDDEHIERCFDLTGCFYGAVREVTASVRYRW